MGGVADGTRTHDNQDHNLGLYQLSYSHRRDRDYSHGHGRFPRAVAGPTDLPQFTITSLPITAREPMRA